MASTAAKDSGNAHPAWGAVAASAFNVAPSKDESNKRIGKFIADAAKASIADKGSFSIALSGGSQPEQVKAGLEALSDAEKAELQVDKWVVLYADERCVPNDHEDSNYLNSKPALEAIGVQDSQILKIDTSVGDAAAQAQDYEKRLLAALGQPVKPPRLDLIMLGMGPDGHTASLFPGHPLLHESSAVVAPISDSPKPPSERITLTLPVIQAAARVAFTASGSGKADILSQMWGAPLPSGHPLVSHAAVDATGETDSGVKDLLPAALAAPVGGQLKWFVDTAAVSSTPLASS